MSTVAAHPTGLGSYATRICEHITHSYESSVIAPPHVVVPDGATRIAVPASVAIGNKARSRMTHLLGLAQRQAFYLRGPFSKDDFVYNPTHHGFFNTNNQIVTIHDLIALHFPQNFPRQTRFFRSVMPRLIARSRAVFVVSEFTKNEVLAHFDITADKVYVVPNSFDTQYIDISTKESISDYLLVVGCHLPHKNVEEILHISKLWSKSFKVKILGASGYYGG
jgi:glycosyltransferase involved in cell wall biosynthesis